MRADRAGHSMSVVMMDIDNFKSINDRHGHGFGDRVIRRLAATADAELRDHVDLAGRLGGEEFAIVLPETDGEGAGCCAERIRAAIAAIEFEAGGGCVRVTASFGVAEMLHTDRSFRACLNRADAAMYQAKAEGRDRVVAWTRSCPLGAANAAPDGDSGDST
jgi:diguanylate cyclase (GGDEF)-like protein